MASLLRSPTSLFTSEDALTYVPMPPFHRRSTGAARMAFISCAGVIALVPGAKPNIFATGALIRTDLADLAITAPPSLIRDLS